MSYDQIAHIVKLGGTVFFFTFFLLVLVYVFWPKNKAKFKQAASMPIADESLIPDTQTQKTQSMEAKP
ncbi:MAG: cbb3-type cytochrome c oxidase subunit 3 [Robiginitomaculum sp.]|nr:cbb3-type cytochrome c oxidase subunit 3 [Robiginitomaculum sp.]